MSFPDRSSSAGVLQRQGTWANELAKRGYVVLVSNAFPFGSRRVFLREVPDIMRDGLNDDNPENPDNIAAYNKWAAEHKSVMAKSLFCAGTTWPGVFFAEDRKALDILCSRDDVDKKGSGAVACPEEECGRCSWAALIRGLSALYVSDS